jgi:hypothetical protein
MTVGNRKTLAAAFALALTLFAVIGVMFIDLATANPAPLFSFPTEPVTTLPTIVVHSPAQNQTYNSANVWLNFTIIKPETWFAFDVGSYSNGTAINNVFGNITAVYYVVDGSERQNLTVHDLVYLETVSPKQALNFSTKLMVSEGAHSVKVSLEADSYYVVRYDLSDPFSSVKLHADSEAVNFTVFPTTTIILVVSGTSVAVVAAGLVVYFKRKRGQLK